MSDSRVELIEMQRDIDTITYDVYYGGVPISTITKQRDYVQESYE